MRRLLRQFKNLMDIDMSEVIVMHINGMKIKIIDKGNGAQIAMEWETSLTCQLIAIFTF
jgi:hypothetical protein